MALDKQKLLSELGSVMNQLQRADCGCMGKLFSNPTQGSPASSTPYSGCNGSCQCHGYCTHNYNNHGRATPCAGEPFPAMNAHGNMNRHCMGFCNPPKMYSDTYNYLNHNLMQPVVNDVYEDLKSITPANTIMNNPLASQMGLSQQKPTIQGNLGSFDRVPMSQAGNENMNSMPVESTMPHSSAGVAQQQMRQMGGMGPQIVNMMMGDGKPWQETAKHNNMPRHGGQTSGPMMMDTPQFTNEQVAGMSLNNPTSIQQAQYNTGNTGIPNMGQEINSAQMLYPSASFGYQQSGNIGTNQVVPQTNAGQNCTYGQGMVSANAPAQQMGASHQNPYGQHSQGISKFNEMFPGVTQKDLGFDPMAIAIQLNPVNHQKVAMETMHKLLNDNKGIQNANSGHMQPIAGVNQIPANIAQQPPNQGQQNVTPNQQNVPQTENQQITPGQQLANYPIAGMQQQQVYRSLADPPMMSQQKPQQGQVQQYQMQMSQQQQNQPQPYQTHMVDPNMQVSEGRDQQKQFMIKEPILPVDTSRNQPPLDSKYNTLGQPVEMLPAKMYQPVIPNLPQTLSPQPIPSKLTNDLNIYSNVKNTVSKTAIAGNRPVGRNPSRSQLQQIYNQYKGSQSFTHQNINMNNHGGRFSEGNLNVTSVNQNPPRQVPIERTVGDMMIPNQMENEEMIGKPQEVIRQIGDVPIASKPNKNIPEKDSLTKQSRYRNGLQDVVYTSYPTSAAWTFHGNSRPYSPIRTRNYRH